MPFELKPKPKQQPKRPHYEKPKPKKAEEKTEEPKKLN